LSTSTTHDVKNRDVILGVFYLIIDILVSVAAQLILKMGMDNLGSFEGSGDTLNYLLSMINIEIVGGLFIYALGVILWLLCLSKLDLSFAYPAATAQYVLIFVTSWYFFNEEISLLRILGMIIIGIGVIVISLDYRKT